MPMDIVPIGPGFAAELRGVTLADVAANDNIYAEVRAAFEDHSVLLFRGQDVTDEAQLAFSRRFGPLETTKVGSEGFGSNLVILKTLDDDGNVVPEDHRLALRNKANQLWHTDSPFKSLPALASVLSSRIIRARGCEIPSRGTTTPILAARSRPVSPARPSVRRYRRNAGAWCGKIQSTAVTPSTSRLTPMRSRAWATWRVKSCSAN